jgi:hypothetical protein
MSKGAVLVAVGVGAVILIGGVAYAFAADSKPIPPPLVPAAPPPPPPSLNGTIYAAGAAAANQGVKAYEAAVGHKLTAKDIIYNVGTGGLYGNYQAVTHFIGKLF